MREFKFTEDILHPRCPECGIPIWLTRIEPDGIGSEKRTFECQACQKQTIETVKKP
jgi:hypothetical protein